MNEDDFIDEQAELTKSLIQPRQQIPEQPPVDILMSNVYWVQCKYSWDRRLFYNKIRQLGAKYNKGPNSGQAYLMGVDKNPYSFLSEEQYFMFKLLGIDHNAYYFDVLTAERRYRALEIFHGIY